MKKIMLGISVLVALSLIIGAGLILNKTDKSSNPSINTQDTGSAGTYKISLPGSYVNSNIIEANFIDTNSTLQMGEIL